MFQKPDFASLFCPFADIRCPEYVPNCLFCQLIYYSVTKGPIGDLFLRTKRSGVRLSPGAPYFFTSFS